MESSTPGVLTEDMLKSIKDTRIPENNLDSTNEYAKLAVHCYGFSLLK